MKKFEKHMAKTFLKGQAKLLEVVQKGKTVLENKDGMSHTVEVLLWVLGAAAIVALIIGLAILLIKNDVFPMFTEKMKEIFNMK